MSVVEMVHAPWPRSEVLRPPELPPFRWAPCMDATCERCRSFQGIQVFYGLAGGLADECWSKMGWHQLMRALAATDEKAPWWQHMGVVGPAMSWHRSLWMVLERSRYGQGFVSAPWFWRHGDVGNQAMNVGWIQGSTTLIALQSGGSRTPGTVAVASRVLLVAGSVPGDSSAAARAGVISVGDPCCEDRAAGLL